MRRSKLAIATSTVVGLSGIAHQAALAGSASNDATAELVEDISVTSKQPMRFGDLLAKGTSTVQVTANGGVTDGGGVTSVGGITQAAKFGLSTSETAESNQTITIRASALTASGTTATLPWRSLSADYNGKSASATQTTGTALTTTITGASVPTAGSTLTAYGGIEVESTDPIGTYTGTVTVTANRE